MRTLGIGIMTNDNPDELEINLSHHVPYLTSLGIPVYVFDNSARIDNSALMKKYPMVIYHKQPTHLSYDEHFVYAVESVQEDYVWILGDKLKVCVGTIPFINDFIQRQDFSALSIGFGLRTAFVGESYVQNDVKVFMRTVAWHTTLCGSTIYNKKLLEKADKQRYVGKNFVHLGILFDGLAKVGGPVAVITHGFLKYFGDPAPMWLNNAVKIWTKDLTDTVMLLPDFYTDKQRVALIRNNGFNGNLLTEQNFMVLASMGYFDTSLLKKYYKYINQASMVPMKRLAEIAKMGDEFND